MRFFLIVLFFLFFSVDVFAQKEIRGYVLNSKNRKPVEFATVTLKSKTQSILGYTITEEDGSFTLKCKNMSDSVTVMVSALTIENLSRTVKSDTPIIELLVKEKAFVLKEVILKAPKIRQQGDTLNYSVATFINETDRSIGDVLKKLPGIKVLTSGKILYQNKPISKFYVEGVDLLKGKYGLATNNIDAQQVAQVQVLENHQPIKVLKNIELPENSAINLKLKESALGAFFLNAQVGVGTPDILMSNELVGMRFTKTQQNMIMYKDDDTGRDISNELTSFYDYISKTEQFLLIQAPLKPEIEQHHYLFNDAHLFSLNDLRKIKRNLIFTSNLNYLLDKHSSNSYSKQDVFLKNGEDIIHIIEDIEDRLIKRELEGSLSLEGNTENFYLQNRLHAKSTWNEHWGKVQISSNISHQLLNQPSFQLENDFSYIKGVSGRRFKIGSNVIFSNQPHSLNISPILVGEFPIKDIQDSILEQDVSLNHFRANIYISKGKKLNRFDLSGRVKVFTDLYNMNTEIMTGENAIPIIADSLQNKIKRNEVGGELNFSVLCKTGESGRISLYLPLKYLHLYRLYKIKDIYNTNNYIFFNPSINYQTSLNTRIDLYSMLSYNNRVGSVGKDYLGYIVNTYRSLNRNDGRISENRIFNASTSLHYKNPFTTLFSDLYLSYSNTWSNMMYDVCYTNMLKNYVSIPYSNNTNSYRVSFSLGKSIDAVSSNIKLSADYSINKFPVMNQGQVSDSKSKLFTITSSIVTDIGQSIILKYNPSYSVSENKIGEISLKPLHYFKQNFTTSFIPLKKLIFNISFNHYYNTLIKSSSHSSLFGNLSAKYKTKRIEWMFDWTNVFNTKRFITYSYNTTGSFYSEYRLRPSEILLRVRFNL